MFAALEAIKNTFFSIKPGPSTSANQVDAITSIVDDDNDSTTTPLIDQPDPILKETEQVELFDKRPYTVNNSVSREPEDFHYLQGENLSQSYDFCLNKSRAVKIHICMVGIDFKCNYSGEHLPFLRFLMEYGQTTIDFPKCEIMCNTSGDSEPDETKLAEIDIYFHNECKKRLLDFFVIEGQLTKTGDVGELLHNSYRGYKEIAEGEIVAVFDITSFLNIPLRHSANPVWMVLDDLENQVLIISPKIVHFLSENEYMRQIRDPLNNLVETPKSLYLYNTENARFMMKSEKSKWLEPRALHPTYGNFYYFKPLNIGKSETPQLIEAYRKCVVFLKNYADFLENDESISLIGEHIEHPKSEEPKSESVGGNNSDISLDDVDDLELSEDSDVEEPSQDNHLGEYDKSEIQNNLPFVSVIIFSEKREPMYCVKTESIFEEL